MLSRLNDYRLESLFTDVTIVARGRSFTAHKVILAGGSEYFKRLFLSGFKESQENRVELDEDPVVLEEVLKYIYNPYESGASMKASRLLCYLEAYEHNPIGLVEGKIVKGNFHDYIELVQTLYPEGLSPQIVNHIAKNIKPDFDLSPLEDEFIIILLTSECYRIGNILTFYHTLEDLIGKGHDPKLLALIDYSRLTQQILSLMPSTPNNGTAILPILETSYHLSAAPEITIVVGSDPVLVENTYWRCEYMSTKGKMLECLIGRPKAASRELQLGDVVRGYCSLIGEEGFFQHVFYNANEVRVSVKTQGVFMNWKYC